MPLKAINCSDQLGKGPQIILSTAGTEEGGKEFSFSFFTPTTNSNTQTCPSFPVLLSLSPFLAVNAFLDSDSPDYEQMNVFNKTVLP